jgi:hypothetical protein
MNPHRKLIAYSFAVVGFVVLIAGGWALKDRIQEWWIVRQLQSRDESEVEAAAIRLGESGSINVMTALIEALDCEGRHVEHLRGETRDVVGKALEKVYLRYDPNPSFSLSYWDGPAQSIRILQHVNVDSNLPHGARDAAVALLRKLALPLTPEEQAKADEQPEWPEPREFNLEAPEEPEE